MLQDMKVLFLGSFLVIALVTAGCGKDGGGEKKDGEAASGAKEEGSDSKEEKGPDLSSPRKVIEAYFAAVEIKDEKALFALMTEKCMKAEKEGERSFYTAFFKMKVVVKSWEIEEEKTKDGTTSIRVKTMLFMEGEGEDKEPLRFKIKKEGEKWLIDDVG